MLLMSSEKDILHVVVIIVLLDPALDLENF